MDEGLASLLEQLQRHGVEHDASQHDRLLRLRNVEPQTARLLAVLVRATHARSILELGTSNGYSTLWLADAARSVGGHVLSVDVDRGRSEQAGRNLERAGLSAYVELRVQDASTTLELSPAARWDMIFLDAERPAYPAYWPDLMRTLRPGGLLAVDNVLSHAEEVVDFRALVAADERVSEALAPVGAGLLLVVGEPVSR